MLNNKKIIAIIPARGGSKGLPNKNILNCAGKPLIGWTIDAALTASEIDKIVVSTDSHIIADIAKHFGVESVMRPAKYATDTAGMTGVVSHVIDEYAEENFDYVIVLQPTSPLRNAEHISQAINEYYNKAGLDSTLVSVTKIDKKYNWIMYINESGLNFCRDRDENGRRRQDLDVLYFPNGAIYIAPIKNFQGLYVEHIVPYVMPVESSIDIDTDEDLANAAAQLEQSLQDEMI